MDIFSTIDNIFGPIIGGLMWVFGISFFMRILKGTKGKSLPISSREKSTLTELINTAKSEINKAVSPTTPIKGKKSVFDISHTSGELNKSTIQETRTTSSYGAMRETDLIKNDIEFEVIGYHNYESYSDPETMLRSGLISKKEYRVIKRQQRRN